MAPVGRDDQEPGVAPFEQDVVEPPAVDRDVREPAAVHVARLHVVLERDRAPLQLRLGERRGLGSEALDRFRRVVRLGGVDAQEPHDVGVVADAHVDRVAVDGAGDERGLGAAAVGTSEPPPPERGGGEDRHDHGPGADHARKVLATWDNRAGHRSRRALSLG